ncbi:MAG: hypothetical protein H8E89_07730 [Candidatus Nitrosopelagicus sp.]|nr:hypothetical protein [Candidatus Nitrosopelagicus sp.]
MTEYDSDDLERNIAVCKIRRFTTKESLEYLKEKGFDISEKTFYNHKKKLKEITKNRINLAVEGIVGKFFQLIDTIEQIQKQLWSDLENETDRNLRLKIMKEIKSNEIMSSNLYTEIPVIMDKQIESYSNLPADRKLTKEEYGKWKLDSDIIRLETRISDPADPYSSPLDEIRLKHMKEMRDKNVTKRQN